MTAHPVSTRGRALLSLACGAASIALIFLGWPRRADADVLSAYAQLEQSPVPVRVVGWIQPSAPHVELSPDGYLLRLHAERLGDLTISGRRAAAPASSGAFVWHEGDVTYALETTAARNLVEPRLVSLDVARQQLRGSAWDAWVLYLVYLPAFAIFTVWSASSLLPGLHRH